MDGKACFANEILTHERQKSYLAKGSKGRVHYCFSKTGDIMAVKLLSLTGSRKSIENTEQKAETEIEILKTMRSSRYIVQYYGTVRFINESWIGILIEYMPRGNLYDFLQDYSFPNAPLNLRLRILYDVARGLEQLHNATFDRRIAHNDLKTQNVLLDSTLRAKICDFGGSDFAAHTSATIEEVTSPSSLTHTDHYAAPEFMLHPGSRRTRPMDVFSYGMVTYYILTNKQPFERCSASQIESNYRNDPDIRPEMRGDALPYDIRDDQNDKAFHKLVEIMESCWVTDPHKRKNMKTVRKELKEAFDENEEINEDFVFDWTKNNPVSPIVKDETCITLEELCHRIDNLSDEYGGTGRPIQEVQGASSSSAFMRKKTEENIKEGDEFEIETPNGLYKGVVTGKIR